MGCCWSENKNSADIRRWREEENQKSDGRHGKATGTGAAIGQHELGPPGGSDAIVLQGVSEAGATGSSSGGEKAQESPKPQETVMPEVLPFNRTIPEHGEEVVPLPTATLVALW